MSQIPKSQLGIPNGNHLKDPFPSVEDKVEISTEVWARELRALFEHAKERFGDVSWESDEGGLMGDDRVWGHKAVIYARAPKAFKDRYFISRPFSRSPTSLRSPSPHLLPRLFPSRPTSPPSSYRRPSPLPYAGRSSSLSVDTFQSEGTIRASGDGILRLTHGDTPELFHAQLEWLYTGEGFGDVVEWISAEDDSGIEGLIRDSLGRRGNIHERRDKLGQDLTYMWRAKLYADVRIHLTPQSDSESASEDSDDSVDSLSSTAIFTAHKFILASRSPYFASVLLNPSSFQPHTDDIHLPTPPFTPAALHFCLGYMYAGHLDFSNRTFDLLTAFQIHRAAAYLQLDTLIGEIEARIVHDFCHGLDYTKSHCRKCPIRAARLWKFASAPDVSAIVLANKARTYVIRAWGECWGRDVGLAEEDARKGLVDDVIDSIRPENLVSAFRSIGMIKSRMDAGLRAKGREAGPWVDNLDSMLEPVINHCRRLLLESFTQIVERREFWDLVIGKGFNDDLLEQIGNELIECVSSAKGCIEGPRIYQSLVSSILLKVDPETLQTALPARSRGRQQVERIKDGVIGHVRRRWIVIRDGGGFDGLENWAMKEISDEIEVSLEDLLSALPSTPKKPTRPTPASRPSTNGTLPRSTTLRSGLDTASVRSATASRASVGTRLSTVRASATEETAATPPEASGLKRLRLSSSASTNSIGSSRSVNRPLSVAPITDMTKPQARSPTAARQSSTVTIGSGRRPRPSSPTPSTRPAPRSISGPPRQLMARGSTPRSTPENKSSERLDSPGPTPSVHSLNSVRTTNTSKSTATISKPKPTVTRKAETSEAGPSRLRTTSSATTSSIRSKAPTRPSPAAPGSGVNEKIPGKAPIPSTRVTSTSSSVAANRSTKVEAGLRPRTSSVSTTASVRSKAASVVSKAPSVVSKAPPVPRVTSVAARVAAINTPKPPISKPTPNNIRPPPKQSTTKQPTPRTTPQPFQPKPLLTPQSSSPARNRTTSTASSTSTRSRPMPTAFPSGLTSVQTIRSPSSSTDDAPEARTPRQSLLPALEPTIRRDGSDSSDILALPSSSSSSYSPTKLPPPVFMGGMPRTQRNVSSSSTRSNNSIIRPHPASAFDPPKKALPVPIPHRDIPDGSKPFPGKGVELNIGIPCIINLHSKRARFRAVIKYIGHMQGVRGPWVGIEVEDLDRFGIKTFDKGSKDGYHYFHLTPAPIQEYDEIRSTRQRKIELIRENLRSAGTSKLHGLGLGSLGLGGNEGGLGVRGPRGGGPKNRSVSPFIDFQQNGAGGGGFENPRALFVRPSEVVFVLGAE